MKVRTLGRPWVMIAAVLALLAVMSVSHTALAQPAQTIKLKVADSLPTTHINVIQATKPWMARVAQLSKTKVEFQYFPSEQLGKQNDMLNILKTGVADVVYAPPSVLSGDFPLHTFFALPALYESSAEATLHYQQLLKEGPLHDEFAQKGVRPLFLWVIPSSEVFSVKKAVVSVEDVRGMKVRSQGGYQDAVIKAMGAVPVLIASPDMYVGLQRGTVDATLAPYPNGRSYKFEEVCKYATSGARLGFSPTGYSILQDRWQKLPADVREAMTKAGEEITAATAKYYDDRVIEDASYFEKQGMQINRLSKDERARWAKVLAPVAEQWIKEKGLPGQQIMDAYTSYKKTAGR